ncbi:MAG: RNA pyrophosphohydrolase [Proteobacteria bacterium]|nr:RNA pyrophosphohydrolase [Pseudomonadota bacterium]
MRDSIDRRGFRKNVCIVLRNTELKVLIGRRINDQGWQFPQGGVHSGETYKEAMYRELYEEVGLTKDDVKIIASSSRLFFYKLPKDLINYRKKPLCLGQKQKWYLLELSNQKATPDLAIADVPEFDRYEWIDYWEPANRVISFKQNVYKHALKHLNRISSH